MQYLKEIEMHEVCIDFADGSCEESQQETWPDVEIILEEFRDQPVRIWVDGNIVQQGFVASDEAKNFYGETA